MCIVKDPQVIVTYTGGLTSTFCVLIFPCMLAYYARKHRILKGEQYDENMNSSPFQHTAYLVAIIVFSIITLYFVIVGIATGHAGGG